MGQSYPAFVGLSVAQAICVAPQRPFAPRVRLTSRKKGRYTAASTVYGAIDALDRLINLRIT